MNTETVDMEMSPGQTGDDCTNDDFYCDVCLIQCTSDASYRNHVRGMLHTQKVMLQESPAEASVVPSAPLPVSTIVKKARQAKEYQESKGNSMDKVEYHCDVCECSCTGITSYEQHLNGAKHLKNVRNREMGVPISTKGSNRKKKTKDEQGFQPDVQEFGGKMNYQSQSPPQIQRKLDACMEPLIGLQYITEYQKEHFSGEPSYVCYLCEGKCDPNTIMSHILGHKHRTNYLKEHYMQYHILLKQMLGKKSEVNNMLEEYAREIEQNEGRKRVQVRVELDTFSQSQKRKFDAGDYGGKRQRGARNWDDGGDWGYQSNYDYNSGYYNEGYNEGYGSNHGNWNDYEGYNNDGQYMGGYADYSNQQDFTSNYSGRPQNGAGNQPLPGSYAAYTTQKKRAATNPPPSTNTSSQQSSQATASSSEENPGYKGYCSKTDLNFYLQSLVNTPYTVDNEEEASLALKVSNSLTQALFQYRLKSVPKELLGGFSKQGMAQQAVAKSMT